MSSHEMFVYKFWRSRIQKKRNVSRSKNMSISNIFFFFKMVWDILAFSKFCSSRRCANKKLCDFYRYLVKIIELWKKFDFQKKKFFFAL